MDIMQTYREIRRNFVEKKNVGGQKRPYDDLERFERGVSWFMDRYLPALDNNTKGAGQPLTGVDVLPAKGQIAVPALEGSTITAQYTGTSVEGEAKAPAHLRLCSDAQIRGQESRPGEQAARSQPSDRSIQEVQR